MRRQWALAIAILVCGLAGCTLESVPERGEQCPGLLDESGKSLQFIVKPSNADGEKCKDLEECKCDNPEACPEYAESFNLSICPKDISACHQTQEGQHYCITCSANQVACEGLCYSPDDNKHCGAKGGCNSSDPDSPDYIGDSCGSNYKCVNGKCKLLVECVSEIFCDGECLKLNVSDFNHCGAKGECNSDDPSSKHYKGKNCVDLMGNNSKCQDEVCICTGGFVNVNGICVDPTDNEHCGAQDGIPGEKCGDHSTCKSGVCVCTDNYVMVDGICIDPNNNEHCGATEGVDGVNCVENSNCINGQCVCIEDYAMCDGKCIESKVSNNYCGARGTCDDPDIASENYQGEKCDNSADCVEGECVCDEGYVKCGKECINPSLSNTHCGAKGDCNSEDPKSDHYQGAVCEDDLMCGDGICRHLNGCIDNACSLNDCINTNEKCGMQCMNCTDYGNTTSGFCKIDVGACEFTECKANYHLNAEKSDCVENSLNACAPVNSSDAKDCTVFEHVDSVICSNEGLCTLQRCQKGYHFNQTKTECLENKNDACAAVDSNDVKNCNTENNALIGTCQENGVCSITQCRENYHFNEHKTACVPNTSTECAPPTSSKTAECANSSMRGQCTKEGICDCSNGGHMLDNGSCEGDSDTNCGKHGNVCPTDSHCQDASCHADKCTALTNTLMCTDDKSICKIPAKQTYYTCVNLNEHHTQCFNTGGQNSSNIDCTKRTDSTGKCIYEPELKTSNGWNCECKDPSKHFQHYHDNTGWSWICI
ncbi:MAG: hypothetical protein J6A01_00675 [Proteobacteria bacterium]|nr:hypothetical protein [Pseudomonadota bacterium]